MTSTFIEWYENRIGKPVTDDEVYGYWLFFVGAIAGVVGIALFLGSEPGGTGRLVSIVLAAGGLALVFAGPVIRLPLRPIANYLTYLGLVIAAVAILWLIWGWPGVWSPVEGNPTVVGLYVAGIGLIAAGGILVPLLSEAEEPSPGEITREEPTGQNPGGTHAESPGEPEESQVERDELQTERDDLRSERDALAAELEQLRESQARFELFEDRAGEYRWRLRHRNGNVIADSGEGYTARHNAQNGIESVRRNGLGADLLRLDLETVEGADEDDEEIVPEESQSEFEIYEDEAGEWRWRLVHENGNIIADSGEGYASRSNVEDAVESVKRNAGPAEYLRFDPTGFEIYRDRAGEYRWRLVHRNGEILGDGGEGYATRSGARNAIDSLQTNLTEDDDGKVSFETYEDRGGEYRWRLVHQNGNIMADSGEGYATENGVEDAVERVREYVPEAHVLDIGFAAFEIYEDEAGEWRWRLRHRNGNVIADSGQGYSDRSGAQDGVDSVKRDAPGADVTAPE